MQAVDQAVEQAIQTSARTSKTVAVPYSRGAHSRLMQRAVTIADYLDTVEFSGSVLDASTGSPKAVAWSISMVLR
jgi:hypothetical protein